MEIRIKTNKERLKQCGWEQPYGREATYRKGINGDKCLEVGYYNGHIVECDILINWGEWDFTNPSDDHVCLKDMEILLEELKKLEIEE